MTRLLFFFLLLVLSFPRLQAQSYRSSVNTGNENFSKKDWKSARDNYEKAAKKEPRKMEAPFNIGNTWYREGNTEAAVKSFTAAGERSRSRKELAEAWYNGGTTLLNAAEKGEAITKGGESSDLTELRIKGYKSAIEAFKQSLKLSPEHENARYNLAYAQRRLRDLQQRNQDKNNKNDKKQDQQKQDQQKRDQQKQDQQKQDQQKQDQQKQDQQNQDQQKQDQQKQNQPMKRRIPKQQAEQMLNALERRDKELQKKLNARPAQSTSVEKDW